MTINQIKTCQDERRMFPPIRFLHSKFEFTYNCNDDKIRAICIKVKKPSKLRVKKKDG